MMIRDLFSKQFLMFLATGGIAALVNFGSRFFYSTLIGFSSAVILAYITGMITSFVLTKYVVFSDHQKNWRKSVFFFVVINMIGLVQVWAVTMLLAHFILPYAGIISHADAIAHAIGCASPMFTSFWGHKYFTFRAVKGDA